MTVSETPTGGADGEPPEDHMVNVQTHIGNRPGLIVELRPDSRGYADERDMAHLSRSDAAELRAALGRALDDHDGDHPDSGVPGRVPAWEHDAVRNVRTWGNQAPATLFLAMVEELGEVAEELITHGDIKYPDFSDRATDPTPTEQGQSFIRQMARLGEETREFLETNFEEPAGAPKPEGEREDIRGAIAGPISRPERVRDELHDLAPLCFQLEWALDDENPTISDGSGDGGTDGGGPPEGWPQHYSGGAEIDHTHHMMWDTEDGVYRCIHECGLTHEKPPDSKLDTGGHDNEPMTDGGQCDERTDAEKRRDLFQCPECDHQADARVIAATDADEGEIPLEQIMKGWVETHHVQRDDGREALYFHFKEGELDRGREIKRELEHVWCSECGDVKVHPDESDVEPPACDSCEDTIAARKAGREPPEGDRPDLDHYHEQANRQGRDPHTGGPRTDGGVEWTEQYDTTTYRGPQEYPVPGAWVLGVVEADGIGWRYWPDVGEGLSHRSDVGDELDPDEFREGPAAHASLMNEYPADADVMADPPYHELKVDGEVVMVLKDASEDGVADSEWWAAIAEALHRYHTGGDVETVLSDMGLDHLKADPYDARADGGARWFTSSEGADLWVHGERIDLSPSTGENSDLMSLFPEDARRLAADLLRAAYHADSPDHTPPEDATDAAGWVLWAAENTADAATDPLHPAHQMMYRDRPILQVGQAQDRYLEMLSSVGMGLVATSEAREVMETEAGAENDHPTGKNLNTPLADADDGGDA